jgi:hypothetical protein
MNSKEASSKRLKISHSDTAASSPNGPLVANENGPSTPNSCFPAGILVPTASRLRTPNANANNDQTLLQSPRKSLKRSQMSPLLLPRIQTDEDEEAFPYCYDERYQDPVDFTENSERAFGRVWFDSDDRRGVLKPRLSRLTNAIRGRSPEDLVDVAVELEGTQDGLFDFPFVVNEAEVENYHSSTLNASPARGILAPEVKTPPRKTAAAHRSQWRSPLPKRVVCSPR